MIRKVTSPITARDVLEARRTAEKEMDALRGQIARADPGGTPTLLFSRHHTEKVPGKEEYVNLGRGTNNPAGMMVQQYEYYTDVLHRQMRENNGICVLAEALISYLSDGNARTMCRYFYCMAETDERAAYELHYDRSRVCKKRNKAVDWLTANVDAMAMARAIGIEISDLKRAIDRGGKSGTKCHSKM